MQQQGSVLFETCLQGLLFVVCSNTMYVHMTAGIRPSTINLILKFIHLRLSQVMDLRRLLKVRMCDKFKHVTCLIIDFQYDREDI